MLLFKLMHVERQVKIPQFHPKILMKTNVQMNLYTNVAHFVTAYFFILKFLTT